MVLYESSYGLAFDLAHFLIRLCPCMDILIVPLYGYPNCAALHLQFGRLLAPHTTFLHTTLLCARAMDSKCGWSVTKRPHWKGFGVGQTTFSPPCDHCDMEIAALVQFCCIAIEAAIATKNAFWILGVHTRGWGRGRIFWWFKSGYLYYQYLFFDGW